MDLGAGLVLVSFTEPREPKSEALLLHYRRAATLLVNESVRLMNIDVSTVDQVWQLHCVYVCGSVLFL